VQLASAVRRESVTKSIRLRGVPLGIYQCQLRPATTSPYLPTGRLVEVAPCTDLTVMFAVNPGRVRTIEVRQPLAALWSAASPLSVLQQAGCLNIQAKAQNSRLPGPGELTVFDAFEHVRMVRRDRVLVVVAPWLVEALAIAPAWRPVSSVLHPPPAGTITMGSFKTADRYGNLQVTLFRQTGIREWLADVDIDDAAGLAHVFQVVRNHVTGRPSHPYVIHEILVGHQGLDPGYRLVT
jgi:hypothetical protein